MTARACTSDRPGSVSRRLPPVPASVGEARRLVRALLSDIGREDLEDTASLLVSEVVTNALLHAGTPIDVSACRHGGSLLVEVADGSHHLPVPRRYATTAGTGRGLRMLERLVDDWGVRRSPDGKTVWFALSSPDRESAEADLDLSELDLEGLEDLLEDSSAAVGEGAAPARSTVDVELLHVPLLLHAAWQEHAEALLRELLLSTLGEGDGGDPIAMHAEATDALAIVAEHVPSIEVGLEPDELMRDAIEPRVSLERVVMPVPRGSVASFATLEGSILSALELSRRGDTLTPPTQPEVQQFRHWLCDQVRVQAAGGAAQPWSVDEHSREPALDLGWDASEITGSPLGRIGADEANRIVAVSRSAAELLGYTVEELVGRRLVTIIPERFRQAHIAGFTLLSLTGRQPLLGRRVEVPALRKDGGEVLVSLLVTMTRSPGDRPLFVAEVEPAAAGAD